MKARLYTDIERKNLYSKEEVEIKFNKNKAKCKIDKLRKRSCIIVFSKQLGRTKVNIYMTKIQGQKVYFRHTYLISTRQLKKINSV